MQRLWAPWRITYVKKPKEKQCLFCRVRKENKDSDNFVILRTKKTISLLNIYPYSNGHIMIAPARHTAGIEKLSPQEIRELFFQLKKIIPVLKSILKPQGFNVGFNLGRSAGAGLDRHLHLHIVPRWMGDTNFMPVLADTKVIAQSLEEIYRKIKNTLKP